MALAKYLEQSNSIERSIYVRLVSIEFDPGSIRFDRIQFDVSGMWQQRSSLNSRSVGMHSTGNGGTVHVVCVKRGSANVTSLGVCPRTTNK